MNSVATLAATLAQALPTFRQLPRYVDASVRCLRKLKYARDAAKTSCSQVCAQQQEGAGRRGGSTAWQCSWFLTRVSTAWHSACFWSGPVLSCLVLSCLGLPSLGEMTLFAIWKYFSLSWPAPGPVPAAVPAPAPPAAPCLSCTAYVNRCHSTVLVPPHSFVVYFELVLTYFMAIFLMCSPPTTYRQTPFSLPPYWMYGFAHLMSNDVTLEQTNRQLQMGKYSRW